MNRTKAFMALCAVLALLSACGAKPVTIEKISTVYVEKPIACPSPAERARIKALRPKPLREQPMPPTAVERNAKAQAQLGLYEAEGGYADQVDATLDRCQKP